MIDTMKIIRWKKKEANQSVVEILEKQLQIHPLLCKLLAQRGVSNFEEAKKFFRPTLDHLHDPFLMKDMQKAIERIEEALAQNQKILIFGDYDVDGTTAVALTYTFFKKIYPHVGYYVPDRYSEGYGISTQGIDYAFENNFSLVIALDCGIKSLDKIEYATSKNIDFIICDHHLPGNKVPAAYAVLDPKQEDCPYPYKELSGCGIGFKLCQAYVQKHGLRAEEIYQLLDFVAVSIAADIVPVTGENRVLAYFGLQKINQNPSPGIRSIISSSGKKNTLCISDLVFSIGPRINAAGRIKHAMQAVELLIAGTDESKQKTDEQADNLNATNTERQGFDRETTDEALSILLNDAFYENRKSTVLYQAHWHKGVIGIVASRLIEHFYRPTIILTESNGVAAGSARSVKGFNIYEAIHQCADLLSQYGGHFYAAGMTLPIENVPLFIERFEQIVAATISEEALTPEIEIDAEINFADIQPKFYKILSQFAPFGPGNMRPVFMTKNVKDRGTSRIIGTQGNHIKLSLEHRNASANAIAFGMAHYAEHILANGKPAMPFDICYTLEENEWNGQKNLQLNIKDIKIGHDS